MNEQDLHLAKAMVRMDLQESPKQPRKTVVSKVQEKLQNFSGGLTVEDGVLAQDDQNFYDWANRRVKGDSAVAEEKTQWWPATPTPPGNDRWDKKPGETTTTTCFIDETAGTTDIFDDF